MLVIVFVVLCCVAVYLGKKGSLESQFKNSSVVTLNSYVCTSCDEVFNMEDKQAWKLVEDGKVHSPSDGPRQFPCEACGETTAVLGLEVIK